MEEAISQLQDLGVTRGQAKKALARYNNDVARAADFIFSGADLSDDETDEPTLSDEQLAIRLSMEEQSQQEITNNSNPFTESTTTTAPESAASSVYKIEPVHLDKTKTSTKEINTHDTSQWSVVPFRSDVGEDQQITASVTPVSDTNHQLVNDSRLTWWKDPENPSERLAVNHFPTGLRPPSYNFAYSPILIQALFHVTAFQHAVLSFKPTPYTWGSPKDYWKGFGEPVPGYIMRQVVSKRQAVVQPSSSSSTWNQPTNVVDDLIDLDDDMTKLSMKEDEKDNSNEQDQIDASPMITETAQKDQESVIEFVDYVEDELQLMPQCLKALAEMQKLFAFLGNTSRMYGNVSHYVRALNSKPVENGWEFNDKSFEAFLDMMISGLADADEQSDAASDPSYIPIFRSMFLLKAKIEYGDDYDNEEVYYLTISIDKHMNSFHGCLDPLVFESYEVDLQDNQLEEVSDDASDEDEALYKFTTFKQIPPILLIVLENRTAPKKSSFQYTIDKTIYMDRYMTEKKEKSLQGFKEMEACRREVRKATLEMNNLKRDSTTNTDKCDLLSQTLAYFKQKQQEDDQEPQDMDSFESLQHIINTVKEEIESRLEKLTTFIAEQREKMHSLFNSDDMKENPYGLRATFHHDGKSGTGHYWAYIWTEPAEESLLSDIPSRGRWFKFCDASVTRVSEDAMLNDPVPPFSLMYVNDSIPKFSKDQLYACIPETLKEFITADKNILEQEIYAYDHPQEGITSSFLSTPIEDADDEEYDGSDDIPFTEKINNTTTAEFPDLESSSATFDDNTSVGTAVNGQPINVEFSSNDIQQCSFTGGRPIELKNRATTKILEVASYPKDDYRFLQSFDIFLARAENQQALEHLYRLYSSEKTKEGTAAETEIVIDEIASKQDARLKLVWQEYESYFTIATMVTGALRCFVKKDYHQALQSLLDTKRLEDSWKTQILWDSDMSERYPGLDTVSFKDIVETYGKACLKILNDAAYTKASNPSYRSRGLEDAIRIAYQAQTIIGPDNIAQDTLYPSLGQLWLSFTEEQAVGSELTDDQVELLNTLIVIYLDGQSGGWDSGPQSRTESPVHVMTDDEASDSNGLKPGNAPLWQKYKQVCLESSQILTALDQ